MASQPAVGPWSSLEKLWSEFPAIDADVVQMVLEARGCDAGAARLDLRTMSDCTGACEK